MNIYAGREVGTRHYRPAYLLRTEAAIRYLRRPSILLSQLYGYWRDRSNGRLTTKIQRERGRFQPRSVTIVEWLLRRITAGPHSSVIRSPRGTPISDLVWRRGRGELVTTQLRTRGARHHHSIATA
ncbi:hypothetical protein VTI28DRAFT_3307 [Corynascus sepedonium]